MKAAAALALALAALAAGASAPAGTTTAAAAPDAACSAPRIGFLGPLTGHAAFIGKEQLGFARYAVRRLAHRRIRLVESDTRLDPARARRAAAALHASPDVLAVVGPAGSQEVLAAAPVLTRAPRLAFVSGSALAPALTNGSIPSFFRVVPRADRQAATIVAVLRGEVKARRVAVVDDGSSYSRPLAAKVQVRLRAVGIRVTRLSTSQRTTEFAPLVARIGAGVDAVFLPWQVAASAQVFGRALRARGSDAVIVGSDGLDSGDFSIAGSYVATFAPDIRGLAGNEAFLAGYGRPLVSSFGPPAYVAAQVAIAAVTKACADGRATRDEVTRHLRATRLPRTVLGRALSFTADGDARGAAFAVFRLEPGGARRHVR